MSVYRRNTLVGITILGAILILGWMILRFGGRLASPFAPNQVHLRLVTGRADGVSDGTAVLYKGVATGRVERVYLHDINEVYIEATIDASPTLPGNLKGIIKPVGFIGGSASIMLELTGDSPEGQLKDGDTLRATFASLDLIPPELADEVRQTAETFRKSNVMADFDETVRRFGTLAQSLQDVAGDKASQADLKTSLANIKQSTEDIRKFSGRLDQLSADAGSTLAQAKETIAKTATQFDTISHQVNDRMTQIATLLDNANAITAKVNNGQGTAGQLVNDPKLYASLVDTAQEMDATVKDLKRLVEQWEQEGVSLKLK